MRALALLLLLPGLATAADEPSSRDPTAWPPALRAAMPAPQAGAASGPETTAVAIQQVVFAGGKGYVVQRGRRYGVGELLDGARIERITEQAVWLREASGQVRREPLYGSVEKRPPPTAASGVKNSKEKP